ncbi:MAG: hypothetical protein EP344_11715 [Bacteroidetes bacterium]|nr:MAG: hypothetical protein EP344_11715 [Bacteroidota bacterium]
MAGSVPKALKRWFVVHCIIDMVFAIPLFLAPAWFLDVMGWPVVDPLTSRLVGAALFGIGLESYFGRHGTWAQFNGMLRLKIIWSAFATLGILWTLTGMEDAPPAGWLVLAVFAGFNGLWVYWYRKVPHRVP